MSMLRSDGLRRLDPVNYKVTRTNRRRSDSPDAPAASVRGRVTRSRVTRSFPAVRKRGRPVGTTRRKRDGKEDKDIEATPAEPASPEPASPEATSSSGPVTRGRGRPGLRALVGRPVSTPPPRKKKIARPVTPVSPVLSARDKRARDRRIAIRNAVSPIKSALRSSKTDSVEKKEVKFAAGVKKPGPVSKGKGKGMTVQQLMFAFFREHRESVQDLEFRDQQKALGAMWNKSPVNPKNEISNEPTDENSSNTSEQPSEDQPSPSVNNDDANENSHHPDDVFTDNMDGHGGKYTAGTSAGPSDWDTTDSSLSTPASNVDMDPMNPGVILERRPAPTRKYPDDDPDGIYYLTDEEDAADKKKTRADSKFTQRLKQVSIGDAHPEELDTGVLGELNGQKGERSGADDNHDGGAGDDDVQHQVQVQNQDQDDKKEN
ncbi:hypothetical protein BC567DRAFT_297729 [Phyllosticta citribraziliensis]